MLLIYMRNYVDYLLLTEEPMEQRADFENIFSTCS